MRLVFASDSGGLTVGRAGGPARLTRFVGDNTFTVGDTRYIFGRGTGTPQTVRVDAVYGFSTLARKP